MPLGGVLTAGAYKDCQPAPQRPNPQCPAKVATNNQGLRGGREVAFEVLIVRFHAGIGDQHRHCVGVLKGVKNKLANEGDQQGRQARHDEQAHDRQVQINVMTFLWTWFDVSGSVW